MVHLLAIGKADDDLRGHEPIVAWSMSFPATRREEERVEYVVNTTWEREHYPEDDDEEADPWTMASDDPWRSISAPASHASQINARRVTQATALGICTGPWTRNRNVLLILQHSWDEQAVTAPAEDSAACGSKTQPADGGSDERIVIRLTDPEQRDIFLRFCRDIVDATALAHGPKSRPWNGSSRSTWRWHRLLQGGRDKRLGDDEQRGLIGELVVLERQLLPALDALDAVRCWTGPLWMRLTTSRFPGSTSRRKAQGFRHAPCGDFLRTTARVGAMPTGCFSTSRR